MTRFTRLIVSGSLFLALVVAPSVHAASMALPHGGRAAGRVWSATGPQGGTIAGARGVVAVPGRGGVAGGKGVWSGPYTRGSAAGAATWTPETLNARSNVQVTNKQTGQTYGGMATTTAQKGQGGSLSVVTDSGKTYTKTWQPR